jgi:hypothetical protein
MRHLLLVGALLGAASSPARDARTTFTVGAYVVDSCEVSTTLARGDSRCAGIASRELRGAASSTSPNAVVGASAVPDAARGSAGPSTAARDGASGDAAATASRVLLIRF